MCGVSRGVRTVNMIIDAHNKSKGNIDWDKLVELTGKDCIYLVDTKELDKVFDSHTIAILKAVREEVERLKEEERIRSGSFKYDADYENVETLLSTAIEKIR